MQYTHQDHIIQDHIIQAFRSDSLRPRCVWKGGELADVVCAGFLLGPIRRLNIVTVARRADTVRQ